MFQVSGDFIWFVVVSVAGWTGTPRRSSFYACAKRFERYSSFLKKIFNHFLVRYFQCRSIVTTRMYTRCCITRTFATSDLNRNRVGMSSGRSVRFFHRVNSLLAHFGRERVTVSTLVLLYNLLPT